MRARAPKRAKKPAVQPRKKKVRATKPGTQSRKKTVRAKKPVARAKKTRAKKTPRPRRSAKQSANARRTAKQSANARRTAKRSAKRAKPKPKPKAAKKQAAKKPARKGYAYPRAVARAPRPTRPSRARRPIKRASISAERKRKARKVVKTTAKQRSAITKAVRGLESLGPITPRTTAQSLEIHARRRAQLIRTLEKAGFSSASIRARLGWIRRRQNDLRRMVARARLQALGTSLIDGRTREGWYTLTAMIEQRDVRFVQFVASAGQLGLSYTEAKDEWYSPTMLE